MSAKNERIDQRVLNAMRHANSMRRKLIAEQTGLDIAMVGISINRLRRQGYISVKGPNCYLTELAHNVCFGSE